jgi:hypothetical protein
MPTYQLRLKQDESLDQLLHTLAQKMEVILATEFAQLSHQRSIHQALPRELRRIFGRYIATYSTCGQDTSCDCYLLTTRWLQSDALFSSERMTAKVPLKRLIISIPTDLEAFLNALENAISGALLEMTGGYTWPVRKLKVQLDQAIRETFGPHLFESMVCGQAPICQLRTPANPWEAFAV